MDDLTLVVGEGSTQRKVAANPGWKVKVQDMGQGNLVAEKRRTDQPLRWLGRAVGKKRGS